MVVARLPSWMDFSLLYLRMWPIFQFVNPWAMRTSCVVLYIDRYIHMKAQPLRLKSVIYLMEKKACSASIVLGFQQLQLSESDLK